MLSVGIFGAGLLGGLGSIAAAQASATYQTSENSKDELIKSNAESLYIGYLISTIVLLGSMIAFIVLLSLSFYKKP